MRAATARPGGACFAEVEYPDRYTEYFSVASWPEPVRQAERATRDDVALLDRIAFLTAGGRRPAAVHGIAAGPYGSPVIDPSAPA